MKKISSGATVFNKKVFPVFWFGFLAFFLAMASQGAIPAGRWEFVVMPLAMGAFVFVVMKKMVWDLADEVHDGGSYLLIRKGSEEERVALSNIMNVSASLHSKPQRVTLRLVQPGKFGAEIAFSPKMKFSFNPFAKNPIVEDLIVRVDRARRA